MENKRTQTILIKVTEQTVGFDNIDILQVQVHGDRGNGEGVGRRNVEGRGRLLIFSFHTEGIEMHMASSYRDNQPREEPNIVTTLPHLEKRGRK